MIDRFVAKIDKHGPRAGRLGFCWVWTSTRNSGGYGQFMVGSRTDGSRKLLYAHRLAWGDVPDGMDVLHKCDNPPCVRRSHLFLGTAADNMRDAAAKGRHAGWRGNSRKTHCPVGHPYDADNTYTHRGKRSCKRCNRVRTQVWRAERRAA